MKQLTRDEAVRFANNKSYKDMTFREIAEFQINQKCLCMPFEVFHEAIEKTLGRPVFSHEFGVNVDGIKDELFKKEL